VSLVQLTWLVCASGVNTLKAVILQVTLWHAQIRVRFESQKAVQAESREDSNSFSVCCQLMVVSLLLTDCMERTLERTIAQLLKKLSPNQGTRIY
jgi:hypothetical protein